MRERDGTDLQTSLENAVYIPSLDVGRGCVCVFVLYRSRKIEVNRERETKGDASLRQEN